MTELSVESYVHLITFHDDDDLFDIASELIGCEQSTYEHLLSMGFGNKESETVARRYGSDANSAIRYLLDIHADESTTLPELQPRLTQWRTPLFEFKESEMSRKLVGGFFRASCDYALADVLQSMIIKYTNLHFVRLIDGYSHSVLAIASHSNRSLRSIAQSFEANDKVHFWFRFAALRQIYPIDTKSDTRRHSNHFRKLGAYGDFSVTSEDVAFESDERWVEVPDDLYNVLTLHALNALGVYEILIKRWPILDLAKMRAVDPDVFDEIDDYSLDAALKGSAVSVCKDINVDFGSLRVGDIIDVCDCEGEWYEAVVRLARSSFICVHFIGWISRWDEKLCRADSERVAKRGTHTNGAHIKDSHKLNSVRCYPALTLPETEGHM